MIPRTGTKGVQFELAFAGCAQYQQWYNFLGTTPCAGTVLPAWLGGRSRS
jgi:hypothetical protein